MNDLLAFLHSPDVWTAMNAFFGSFLGASFYVLIKTQPYLVNRSYDPKFNASYISRFITGVIAGLILAIALGPFIASKLDQSLSHTLTPGVLALLGGFSAEAVEQVLQRIVEILLTAVRGNGSDESKAKVAAAFVRKDANVRRAINAAMDAHASGASPRHVKILLNKVREEVEKPVTPR